MDTNTTLPKLVFAYLLLEMNDVRLLVLLETDTFQRLEGNDNAEVRSFVDAVATASDVQLAIVDFLFHLDWFGLTAGVQGKHYRQVFHDV